MDSVNDLTSTERDTIVARATAPGAAAVAGAWARAAPRGPPGATKSRIAATAARIVSL